jgi:hypothetical protein
VSGCHSFAAIRYKSAEGMTQAINLPVLVIHLIIMILAINTCISVTNAATTDIYVSPTGDDVLGSGSSGSPYQTIRQAFIAVGSTSSSTSDNYIHLNSGTYSGSGNTDIDVSALLSPLGMGAAVTMDCLGFDGTCIINATAAQRFAYGSYMLLIVSLLLQLLQLWR